VSEASPLNAEDGDAQSQIERRRATPTEVAGQDEGAIVLDIAPSKVKESVLGGEGSIRECYALTAHARRTPKTVKREKSPYEEGSRMTAVTRTERQDRDRQRSNTSSAASGAATAGG